jgi:hypothetical protein
MNAARTTRPGLREGTPPLVRRAEA